MENQDEQMVEQETIQSLSEGNSENEAGQVETQGNIVPEEEKAEGQKNENVKQEEVEDDVRVQSEIKMDTANDFEVKNAITDLINKVEDMSKLFEQKIRHTEHESKILDQMHAELQVYKEDMYAKLVRPILLDIIEVRDSIVKMTQTYSEKPKGERDIPNKIFAYYADDMQEILEKNEIEIYQGKEGDDFVPIKQRIIKKIPTQIETLHGKIAETVNSGYVYNGKTISPEKVGVYLYEEPKQEEFKESVE